MQKQQIIIVACVVFGVFFAEVLIPFIIERVIIEREKKKPHQLSWQASLLIILFVLTAFVLIFIL